MFKVSFILFYLSISGYNLDQISQKGMQSDNKVLFHKIMKKQNILPYDQINTKI